MPSSGGAGRRRLLPQAVVGATVVLLVGATAWVFQNRSREGHAPGWEVPANAAGRFLSNNAGPSLSRSGDLMGRLATERLGPEELWAGLANRGLPWSERSVYLMALAVAGGVDSARRLVALYLTEPSLNQGAFARVLSEAGCAGFLRALESLLEDGDDAHAAAAIRGLAGVGGDNALQLLADIMNDDAWPEDLRRQAALGLLQQGNDRLSTIAIHGLGTLGDEGSRAELSAILHNKPTARGLRLHAAAALGRIGSPQAAQDLVDAFEEFSGEEEQTRLLDALGHCPFPVVDSTFREFLADPASPDELRVAATEALSNSSAEAVPFLQNLAASDPDADVREMAAWAISTREPGGQLGPELARMIGIEPEPDVRRRLYEGLLVQAENPAESLLPTIQAEDDPAARIAAINAVGDAVGRGRPTSLASPFDAEMVPELETVAMGESSLNLRMRAVFALRRAGTPASKAALARISSTHSPEIAKAAANGLLAKK